MHDARDANSGSDTTHYDDANIGSDLNNTLRRYERADL